MLTISTLVASHAVAQEASACRTASTISPDGIFCVDLRAAQQQSRNLKIAQAREVPSVCRYCAVGCGQIVSVRDKKIINIEGNPDSPISQGTLCPKGAATYQLAVNPNRITKVWYRPPG